MQAVMSLAEEAYVIDQGRMIARWHAGRPRRAIRRSSRPISGMARPSVATRAKLHAGRSCSRSGPPRRLRPGEVLHDIDLDRGGRDRRRARLERRRQTTLNNVAISGVLRARAGSLRWAGHHRARSPKDIVAMRPRPGPGRPQASSPTSPCAKTSTSARYRRARAEPGTQLRADVHDLPAARGAPEPARRDACPAASSRCSPSAAG